MTLRHALVRREGRSSGTMSIQSGLRKLGELVDLGRQALGAGEADEDVAMPA